MAIRFLMSPADKLLDRKTDRANYNAAVDAYSPRYVSEVIAALNQDAQHPNPVSPYEGKLLTDDDYLPLLSVVPVWRFTELAPATIAKIGVRNMEWLALPAIEQNRNPSPEWFDTPNPCTWLQTAQLHTERQEGYWKGRFNLLKGKFLEPSMQYDWDLARAIPPAVQHLADHIPAEQFSDIKTSPGNRLLHNTFFMMALCARQEQGLLNLSEDRPLTRIFSALAPRLYENHSARDYLRALDDMPFRGRDFVMLAHARTTTCGRDTNPVIGFDLGSIARYNPSAIPEFLLSASKIAMKHVAGDLEDAARTRDRYSDLYRADLAIWDTPLHSELRNGIRACMEYPQDEKAMAEVHKKIKQEYPLFDLTRKEFAERLERIANTLFPEQVATLQLGGQLFQPQFWNHHVQSVAAEPFNIKTPEEAVEKLSWIADKFVTVRTLGKGGERLAKPERVSVLSLINTTTLISALSPEQLEAVLGNEKITSKLQGRHSLLDLHVHNHIADMRAALGISEENHPRSSDLETLRAYLREVIEVQGQGQAALRTAFEGCGITPPDPASIRLNGEERDYYTVSLKKPQELGNGLVEKLKAYMESAGFPPQWVGQIKYPYVDEQYKARGGPAEACDILIHKDMVHHVKFADFAKEPNVAKAIGAAATSHAEDVTRKQGVEEKGR